MIIGTGNTGTVKSCLHLSQTKLTNTIAHDVAEDMLDAGLESVTMVQRGRTAVFPIEYYKMWSDRKSSLLPLPSFNRDRSNLDFQQSTMPISPSKKLIE